MAQVDPFLLDGEKLVYRTHTHWIALAIPGAVFLVLMPGACIAVVHGFYPLFGPAFATGLWLFSRLWHRRKVEIDVTNMRVIVTKGLFNRDLIDINLDKLGRVDVHSHLMGLFFGYGSVSLSATGMESEKLDAVANVIELRQAILEQGIEFGGHDAKGV
jgi:hypothetical protein